MFRFPFLYKLLTVRIMRYTCWKFYEEEFFSSKYLISIRFQCFLSYKKCTHRNPFRLITQQRLLGLLSIFVSREFEMFYI